MAHQERKLGEFGFAGDDHVVPFEVDALDVRGRIVELGPMLDQILTRHDYPEPVARLLAEACVVTVLLGPPPELTIDDDEMTALDALASGGLVPPLRLVEPVPGPVVDSA